VSPTLEHEIIYRTSTKEVVPNPHLNFGQTSTFPQDTRVAWRVGWSGIERRDGHTQAVATLQKPSGGNLNDKP